MNKEEIVLLKQHIQLIAGYNRGIMYDFYKNEFHYIPGSLVRFVDNYFGVSLAEIFQKTEYKVHPIIDSYLNHLNEKEALLFVDEAMKNAFPNVSLEYDSHALISNVVVESRIEGLSNLIKHLERLGVSGIFLECSKEEKIEDIIRILSFFQKTAIDHIEISLDNKIIKDCKELFECEVRLQKIIVFNAEEDKNVMVIPELNKRAHYLKRRTFSDQELIKMHINFTLFTESQKFNNFYNKKAFFSEKGEIKNSSSGLSFGHYNKKSSYEDLKTILTNDLFQEIWYASKDDCDICKDCEFRYTCIDNRVPKRKTDGTWYNNNECRYNPYISKWKGEKEYKTLKDCGVISNAESFFIDHKKIEEINQEIWEE